jgi:hypothetical protein
MGRAVGKRHFEQAGQDRGFDAIEIVGFEFGENEKRCK